MIKISYQRNYNCNSIIVFFKVVIYFPFEKLNNLLNECENGNQCKIAHQKNYITVCGCWSTKK